MNLTDLISKLRKEAKKTEETASCLRIAADMIEHLQEERNGLVEANADMQKSLFKLGDKLCACQSQIPISNEEGQCKSCVFLIACPPDKKALYKFDFKKCPEYKGAEKKC